LCPRPATDRRYWRRLSLTRTGGIRSIGCRKSHGPVKIVAEAVGFGRAERTMAIGRNFPNIWDAGLTLASLADSGYRVGGRVFDGRKRPLANATVSLLSPYTDGKFTQIRTDLQGHFLFDNVAPGEYVVIVTRPAYEAASRLVTSLPSRSNMAEDFMLAACKRCPEGRLK
jgi:hypothetical protein